MNKWLIFIWLFTTPYIFAAHNDKQIVPSKDRYEQQMQEFIDTLSSSKEIKSKYIEDAIRLCVQRGPTRSHQLMKLIIEKHEVYRNGILRYLLYPKYHKENIEKVHQQYWNGILRYSLYPASHKENIEFPSVTNSPFPEPDLTTGISLIKELADQDHTQAQVHYAMHCKELYEKHVEDDPKQADKYRLLAKTYFQKAAEKDTQAAFEFASIRASEHQYNEAYQMLLPLSRKGDPRAMIELGNICAQQAFAQKKELLRSSSNEKRKKKDQSQHKDVCSLEQQALRWYDAAGQKGSADGYYKIAKLHAHMYELEKQYRKHQTNKAYDQAQKIVNSASCRQANRFIKKGNKLQHQAREKKISHPEQSAHLEQQAIDNYLHAAQSGEKTGWLCLSILHSNLFEIEKQKRTADEHDAYHKALKIDPHHVESLTNLAADYENNGNTSKAIELLKRACAADPEYEHSYNNLYAICLRLIKQKKKIRKVEDLAAFMVQNKEECARTWNLFGMCAQKRGDHKNAIAYFVEAGNCGSSHCDSSQGWYHAGTLSKLKGDIKQAKKYYKKAIDIASNNTEAHYELAQLYDNEKQYFKAQPHFFAASFKNPHAKFKAGFYMQHGISGIYNPKLASELYRGAAKLQQEKNMPFETTILWAKIAKVQDHMENTNIDKQELDSINEMVDHLIRHETDGTEGRLLIQEAHFSRAQCHILHAQIIEQKVEDYKQEIGGLKKDYMKNKNQITKTMDQIKKQLAAIKQHYQDAIKELHQSIYGEDDFRSLCTRAELLQRKFFPEKPLAQMTPEQKEHCKQAQKLYEQIIERAEKIDPGNAFLFKARCNLSKMYRHLFKDEATTKIKQLFTAGTDDEAARCFVLAHCYEAGLLSANGKPDYIYAVKLLEKAHKLDRSNKNIHKELIFYKHAAGQTDNLTDIEKKFIKPLKTLVCKTFAKTDILQTTHIERLELYPLINFIDEKLFSQLPIKKESQ